MSARELVPLLSEMSMVGVRVVYRGRSCGGLLGGGLSRHGRRELHKSTQDNIFVTPPLC
jgi:hypothetical protein